MGGLGGRGGGTGVNEHSTAARSSFVGTPRTGASPPPRGGWGERRGARDSGRAARTERARVEIHHARLVRGLRARHRGRGGGVRGAGVRGRTRAPTRKDEFARRAPRAKIRGHHAARQSFPPLDRGRCCARSNGCRSLHRVAAACARRRPATAPLSMTSFVLSAAAPASVRACPLPRPPRPSRRAVSARFRRRRARASNRSGF